MLLQNLHRRYLYILIKLPHLLDLEQRIPSLHQVICNTFKIDYFQEMDTIVKL